MRARALTPARVSEEAEGAARLEHHRRHLPKRPLALLPHGGQDLLFGDLLALGLYNLIFALPLLAFLALFLAYRQRFAAPLERLSREVRVWTPWVVKYGSVTFGALLLNSAAFPLADVALSGSADIG